jgi:hypothetical protein
MILSACGRSRCSPTSQVLWNCLTPRQRACRTYGLCLLRPIRCESSGCFRGLSASARKVSNRAGGLRLREGDVELAMALDAAVAFPLSGQGRPPQRDVFGAQYTARLCLCERFATPITRRYASLEAGAAGYALPRAALSSATLLRLTPTHPVPLEFPLRISLSASGFDQKGLRDRVRCPYR